MTSDSLQASQLLSPLHQLYPKAKRWVVAYSGGVDSHVLLHLCWAYLQQNADGQQAPPTLPELLAIHINHQLQDEAQAWAEHCAEQARQLGVELQLKSVEIDRQPQQSLEEQARLARYKAFGECLRPGDLLLQGHHSNDQAETFLLRALRGSGSLGLGSIPRARALGGAELYRPLLGVTREVVESYAKLHGLQWVEDPSNQQLQYDRNFLRSELVPVLEARWPQYLQGFTRAARLSAESAQLNQELAQLDWQQLSAGGEELGGEGLSVEGLKQLSPLRCKNLLRFWLLQHRLPLPSEAQLNEVIGGVVNAKPEAQPQLILSGCEFYRFAGKLIARVSLPAFERREYRWDAQAALALQGAGELVAKKDRGSGLRLAAGDELRIRFRRGGESLRPAGRGGSRKVKKLLQECGVPYWLRDRVPLLYCGEELIAVADMVVAEGWRAGPSEQGIEIHWKRP